MCEVADEATPKPRQPSPVRGAFAYSPAACGFARSDEDAALSPAAILGHIFRGDAMRIHVPSSVDEMAWFAAAVVLCGSGLGILVTLLRGS